jgi:hypothetical protein
MLVDLAPDVVPRVDHVKLLDRAGLVQMSWRGTREGGAFEIPTVGTVEWDEQGRLLHLDVWGPDQLDQARARFEELAAPAPTRGGGV